MPQSEWNLDRDGFCFLQDAVDKQTIRRLLADFDDAFSDLSPAVLARSSRGHVYAARNLIESIAKVTTVWQVDPMLVLLRKVLGDDFGLVRALLTGPSVTIGR